MTNRNTKYWSFTWDTNVDQKKLPNKEKLCRLLGRLTSTYAFQEEIGTLKGKAHFQGVFTLDGPRLSKTKTLDLFKENFSVTAGLTLKPVYDKVAILNYVTKNEGRLDGPFYGGKNEMFDSEMSQAILKPWQQDLFDLVIGEQQSELRDRKVIFIQDIGGNTGKSWFQKWLRTGQKKIVARSLPVSTVDRLISAVNIITKGNKVDLLNIDLTKTEGENQSYKDLFSAIEQIKNGYVIDVMYGKYNEAIFKPPVVIVYSNHPVNDFTKFLSKDRWLVFGIKDSELVEVTRNGYDSYSFY